MSAHTRHLVRIRPHLQTHRPPAHAIVTALIAGLAAVVLTGGWTAIMNNAAFVALGLAVVSAALIFVPPTPRYFSEWAQVRAARPEQYRRPEWIFYGRLPRFR